MCIRNKVNYNFSIITSIILLNCFQTLQIIFKSVFYSSIYIVIASRMTGELCHNSACGDNCQRPIWSNIGILYGVFDVFHTIIINTFIQIIFGTIGMHFRSF